MSVYNKIRGLVNDLSSTRVTERRAKAVELNQLLADVNIRRRVAMEAGGQVGGTARLVSQRAALTEMWRMIIQKAIHVKQLNSSKAKLTLEDVMMPFRLFMRYIDSERDEWMIDPHIPLKYQCSSMLSKAETKNLFQLCFDLLHDDRVVGGIPKARVELLNMMNVLCSRRDVVVYMRPMVQTVAVLKLVEDCLLAEDKPDFTICAATARIFCSLIRTMDELDMGMQLTMAGSVKFVALWCVESLKNLEIEQVELPYLFQGLSVLLKSDLELAVASVTRHGRPILSLVKKRYAKGVVEEHISAMNDYLIAHLYVQ